MSARGGAPWVLGISASHNGAYCLLRGHDIHVAVQEERLVGVKRARVYGARRALGLQYCLDAAGITAADLSMIVLSCQGPAAAAENDISRHPDLAGLAGVPLRIVPHHLAHAASAIAASGHDRAAVLVVDGAGSAVADLCAASRRALVDAGAAPDALEHLSLFQACGGALTPLEIHASTWIEPRREGMRDFFSLGSMYAAVVEQIFGDVREIGHEAMDAGKVMGLAPYGRPVVPAEEFVTLEGNRITFTNLVQRRFPYRDRWPSRRRAYEDLAASVQRALEMALLHTVARLRALSGETRLCMAGGVALNSVANQRICESRIFDDVFIVPYAEDSGVAVGAAYLGLWELAGWSRRPQSRRDAHGRSSRDDDIQEAIDAVPDVVARRPADLLGEVADRLLRGEIGGWFQGGAELGPRALGQRSILCSPCAGDAKETLNARVKFREAFRPFAPSVLAEHAGAWFDFGGSPDSPFMLRVVPFRADRRGGVPAVVHVDGTGRVQTLTAKDHGRFYELVARFHEKSGVPILLNTSMNVRGEPIVETPVDALWCLLGTGLHFCVLHGLIVTKRETFGSVLDYIPVLVADAGGTPGADRTVRASTPWGSVEQRLPPRLVPVLGAIDGRRDGHAVRAALADGRTSLELTHDLLLLRRMRVVRLQCASPAVAEAGRAIGHPAAARGQGCLPCQ